MEERKRKKKKGMMGTDKGARRGGVQGGVSMSCAWTGERERVEEGVQRTQRDEATEDEWGTGRKNGDANSQHRCANPRAWPACLLACLRAVGIVAGVGGGAKERERDGEELIVDEASVDGEDGHEEDDVTAAECHLHDVTQLLQAVSRREGRADAEG